LKCYAFAEVAGPEIKTGNTTFALKPSKRPVPICFGSGIISVKKNVQI